MAPWSHLGHGWSGRPLGMPSVRAVAEPGEAGSGGAEDGGRHAFGGVGLHALDDVSVDRPSDDRAGVAESRRHDVDVHAGDKRECRPRVTEVVQSDEREMGERRLAELPVERVGERFGVVGSPVLATEDQAVIVRASAEEKSLRTLFRPPGPEHRDGCSVELDEARVATLVLGTIRPSRPRPIGLVSGMNCWRIAASPSVEVLQRSPAPRRADNPSW
jgi:hypothetical protein